MAKPALTAEYTLLVVVDQHSMGLGLYWHTLQACLKGCYECGTLKHSRHYHTHLHRIVLACQ